MRLEQLPSHPLHGHARIQGPDIIERLDAVSPAEYVELVPVEHGRVRAPREGQGLRRVGMRPFAGDGIEDIERVVVGRSLSAAEDEDSSVYKRRSVRSAGRREVTCHLWVRPLERLCKTVYQ